MVTVYKKCSSYAINACCNETHICLFVKFFVLKYSV